MVGPAARREGVAHLQARFDLSERRACKIVSADRTMIRYQSKRPPDTELREKLRKLKEVYQVSVDKTQNCRFFVRDFMEYIKKVLQLQLNVSKVF